MRVFFCIFSTKKLPAALRRLLAVCILEKLCFSCRPSPLPCRFPRMRMILFAVLYIIYKLLRFVSFVLFLQRRKFLAILFAFFVYLYVLSKFLENFLFRIKLSIQKGEFFCFFSSVVRKFLSISLFPLCPLFFVTALSPAPPEKPRTDFFTAQHFFSSAQKKTRISLSALPAAACVLRVFFCRIESFILAKSAEENSQHSRIFLFFRGKKTFFSQEFFSQFSRRKLAIYLLYIKR